MSVSYSYRAVYGRLIDRKSILTPSDFWEGEPLDRQLKALGLRVVEFGHRQYGGTGWFVLAIRELIRVVDSNEADLPLFLGHVTGYEHRLSDPLVERLGIACPVGRSGWYVGVNVT